jgi:hypothetical protein
VGDDGRSGGEAKIKCLKHAPKIGSRRLVLNENPCSLPRKKREAFFDPNQQRHQKFSLKLKMSVISA